MENECLECKGKRTYFRKSTNDWKCRTCGNVWTTDTSTEKNNLKTVEKTNGGLIDMTEEKKEEGIEEGTKKDTPLKETVTKNEGSDVRSENGYPKNKIECIVCNTFKGVRPDVMEKRIERLGTEEEVRKTYKCRECRKKGGS